MRDKASLFLVFDGYRAKVHDPSAQAVFNASHLDQVRCDSPGCPCNVVRLACPRGADHPVQLVYVQRSGFVIVVCAVCHEEVCRLGLARDSDFDLVDELVGGAA